MRPSRIVSVVMPAYNADYTLEEPFQSVLAQTLQHSNLLLVVARNSKGPLVPRRSLNRQGPSHSVHHRSSRKDAALTIVTRASPMPAETSWHFLIATTSGCPKNCMPFGLHGSTSCDLSYTGYAQMDWHGNQLPHVLTPPPRLTCDDLLNDKLLGCLTSMIRLYRLLKVEFVDFLHEDSFCDFAFYAKR